MTPPDDATLRQITAARPDSSAWVAANAGSGKTRVLTDRVARLLLGGVEPQHILCLTYTKAAAAEMQNRLFRLLGDWAMKPDADLRAELAALGEAGPFPDQALAQARRLFARALETPGGLRVQTIHSFCAALLRRFPLEAGVAPGFRELDDRSAKLLVAEVLEDMASGPDAADLAALARALPGHDFADLARETLTNREGFAAPRDAASLGAALGLAPGQTAARLIADTFLGDEADVIARALPVLAAGSPTDQKLAAALTALDLTQPDLSLIEQLEPLFLFQSGARQGQPRPVATKPVLPRLGPDADRLAQLAGRLETARPQRLALAATRTATTLHRFAAAFLPRYEAAKQAQGWLDFDDLILRTRALLSDRALAAWVLYRLDGGIDHILVDEAQDTSPAQWQIIELLAAEFHAGEGARRDRRTLFVVGDKKQSIYSFQGADVAAFDQKAQAFDQRFTGAGQPFATVTLAHSFRSSPAVLQAVDQTFAADFPAAVGDRMQHIAFRSQMPGRVDLWPLIEPSPKEKDEAWEDPIDLIRDSHHAARLADQIAGQIRHWLDTGARLPLGPDDSRPITAGDVLILVQRRSTLFGEVIRACKQAGLPIAGADRLKLAGEIAVNDLTALLSFLATPDDDLSLAAVLRSPLFGLDEDALYRLARGRTGTLWDALRPDPGHEDARRILQDLRDRSDFLRPYELLERILIRHDGRRRLLARLGPEAEEGIDALLEQALAYEDRETPSLTGFLIWLANDEVEVKRQAESAGDRIRVMTVHGAKGLEAPIVILPETADRRPPTGGALLKLADGTMVGRSDDDRATPAQSAAIARAKAAQAEESLRLLYVAMTRARNWLIVAGAGTAKLETKTGPIEPLFWAWHALVARGMSRLPTEALPGGGLRHAFGPWPADGAPNPPEIAIPARQSLPDWMSRSAPAAPTVRRPRAPSDLGGAKALPGEGLEEAAALAYGTTLHRLLQHLPDLPAAGRAAFAHRLFPDDPHLPTALTEACAVLDSPALQPLFAPGTLAEVDLVSDTPAGLIRGSIDRLIVTTDRVLAVDFKSNRQIPGDAATVPEGILRQMGAYAAGLARIYPDRPVETAILWTAAARLMPLDPEIVSAALGRAAIP